MADFNEAIVAELTAKLAAYVKILPDHTESTTFRLLQHVTDESVIYDLTTDELMEIDARFHKAVEEMGHILAPNKFNELVIALSFNTPFILKFDPNEPEEEHDHHHHDHDCGCGHHDHHHHD